MPQFGEVRVDFITFTTGVSPEASVTVPVSGLVQNPTFSGDVVIKDNLDVEGNITVSGTVTGNAAGFTSVTGTTVTGTTANFVTISGTTVTGNTGNFTTATTTTVNVTSGIFASGTAAAPSVSIGTTNNGLYSPSANQVAVSTNGTGRVFIDSAGNFGIGALATNYSGYRTLVANGGIGATFEQRVNGALTGSLTTDSQVSLTAITAIPITFRTDNTERMRIDSSGNVGIGTSSPNYELSINASDTVSVLQLTNSTTGSTAADGFLSYISGNNVIISNEENGYMSFKTSGLERLLIDSSGNVGIGTSSPLHGIHVANNLGVQALFERTGAGGAYVGIKDNTPYYTYLGSTNGLFAIQTPGSSYSNKLVVDYNGNVGIDTSAPTSKLEVHRGTITLNATTGSDTTKLRWNYQGTEYQYIERDNATGGLAFGDNVTERMRIDSSGNVGIGTSSPNYALDISATNPRIRLEESGTGGSKRLEMWVDPTTAIGNIAANQSSQQIAFHTSGYERVRIDSSGNVGIGTTSPQDTLQVGSDSYPHIAIANGGSTDVTSGINWRFGGAGTIYNKILAAASGIGTSYLSFYTASSGTPAERMRIDSNGNIGIGTTSPLNSTGYKTLTIGDDSSNKGQLALNNGTGARAFLWHDGSNNLHQYTSVGSQIFYTAATERMRINSSGNVGIGTSSPAHKLHAYDGTGPSITGVFETNQTESYISFKASGTTSNSTVRIGATGDNLLATINSAERMRIDSSGRLLVGASSESGNAKVVVRGNGGSPTGAGVLDIGFGTTRPGSANTALGYLRFTSTSNTVSNYHYASIHAETDGVSTSDTDIPGRLVFSTTADGASSPTERMRIKNYGQVYTYSNSVNAFAIASSGATTATNACIYLQAGATGIDTGTITFQVLVNGNVQNANNSYTGISDIKLKENIADANSQWSDIKAIQVRNYNYKEETGIGTHTQIGVIAQEIESVSPGLVIDVPDVGNDGIDPGTTTKSVNYSVLYMKAVKALQEAMDRIETLEAKVAALEAG